MIKRLMRPLVLHNLAIGILYVATMMGAHFLEVGQRKRSPKKGRSRPEWTFFVGMAAVLVCSAGAVVAAVRHVAPMPGGVWWPTIAGIALMWVGAGLRIWSVTTLGHYFQLMVVVQDDHRVIEAGPYRFVRHPAYLGILISFVGVGLVSSDWVAFGLFMLGIGVMLVARIKFEERTLVQALGSEYSLYMQRTARLVPGVY
jgi:protein-S-isoprenylcysteine O-methyltransferase Ste14